MIAGTARRVRAPLRLLFFGCLFWVSAAAAQSITGTVLSVAKDGSGLRLKTDKGVQVIQVTDQSLKDKLKGAQNPQASGTPCTAPICSCVCPGDKVDADIAITAGDNTGAMTLQDISPLPIAVQPWEPWAVMIATAIVFLAITFILSRNIRGLLFIGEDGRYSNSKTQISLWFGLVVVTYVAAFLMRWVHAGLIGHISIPTNLLMLSGLSALTFAGAKGITTAKNAAATAKGGGERTKRKSESTEAALNTASFPGDLLKSDDGQFDLGDYQMMVIVLITVVSYIWIAANFLSNMPQCLSVTLPDVDGTMLAMFGVGQGAYLTKKAVADINH
ncbi:MAG: hypothetical protein ABSF54_19045 [Bryobacteraceae bacterium]|jgi:hypothetical protein